MKSDLEVPDLEIGSAVIPKKGVVFSDIAKIGMELSKFLYGGKLTVKQKLEEKVSFFSKEYSECMHTNDGTGLLFKVFFPDQEWLNAEDFELLQ